jgi:hypothetical protein
MAEVIQPSELATDDINVTQIDPVSVVTEMQGIIEQGRQSVDLTFRDARDLSLMRHGIDGADVATSQKDYFQAIRSGLSPVEEKARLRDQYVIKTDQYLLDLVRKNASSDDPEARQIVVDMVSNREAAINAQIQESLEFDAGAKTIKELYADESADDFTVRRQTQAYAANQMVADWADETGSVGKVGDFLTTMFAVDTWHDRADLIGGGSSVASAEEVARDVQFYQDLDPDEQAAIFPEIFERIKVAYDHNVFKVADAVAMMHSRDAYGDLMLESTLTALNIAFAPGDIWAAGALVKGAGKLLTRGKADAVADVSSMRAKPTQQPDVPSEIQIIKDTGRQNSVPHGMMQIRNEQAAAESMTLAGMDGEAAKFLGVTRLDAADTASPFRNAELPIIIGSVDTIAESMVRLHKSQIQEVLVAKRIEALRIEQQGNVAVRSGANKRLVTLPRREERLKKDIKILSRTLAKMKSAKPTKSNKAAQDNITLFSDELNIKVQKLAVVRARIKHAEGVVADSRLIDRLDGELRQLESGHVPASLSEHIQSAIAHRAQEAAQAQQRAPKARQAVKMHADDVSDTMAPEAMEVLVAAKLSGVAGRIIDDPLRYGLSDNFAADLRELIRTPLDDLIAETDSVALQKFTETRKKEIQERVLQKITKEAKDAGKEVKVADIVPTGDEGFRVVYRTDDVDEVFEYQYTLSDTGIFEGAGLITDSLVNHMGNLLSPSTLFNDLGRFVNNLTFAGDQAAKIGKRLQDMHKSIHKGLSVNQKRELDSLLLTGDENGRVFSIDELEAGIVETKISLKPQDAATIKAYYQLRAFYDEMHDMRDFFVRKDLKFAGYQDVSYVDDAGETIRFLGRPIDNFRGQDLDDVRVVFTPGGETQYQDLASLRGNIQVWEDSGYKLVEMYEPHMKLAKGKETLVTKFALVADDFGAKVGDLPAKVLNFQPGYIPRVYRKGYSFVKDMRNPARPVTAFATETRADAEKFAAQLNGFADDTTVYVAKGDRELTSAERLVMDADSFGGLYTGARGRRELLVRTSEGGYRPQRVGNGEATARYMSNLASLMPVAEYRHTLMRQWANSVDYVAEKEGRLGLIDKTDFNSPIDLSPQKMAMMENAREYIKTQLKLQTDEEKFLNHTLKKMSDSLYSNDPSKAAELTRSMVRGMIDKDPVQQLKGFTFNMQLGMFNPRQLIMQAQNAVIAASVSPLHAPGAVADALAMRTLVMATDAQLPGLMKVAAKAVGRDVAELQEMVDMFRKTGLWDSIKQNADFDADVVNLGGNTLAKMREVASAGRIFFREGELMARLTSFNIARRRLGPKATPQEVFDEHLRLSMNMQSANAATWQKNWMGVPLQYMQVFTKFYESLIPGLLFNKGKWTRKEAASVLAGQVTVYGTVGIPVAEDAYAYLSEAFNLTPTQAREQYPWVEKSMSQGVFGFMSQMMGIEADFSSDLSLIGGTSGTNLAQVGKAIYQGVTTGGSDVDLVRALAGPSVSTIGKSVDSLRSMVSAAQVLAEDPSLEVLGTQVLSVVDSFAGITSTWSNARKAIFLHDVGMVSKQGNTIFSNSQFADINLQTTLARAMGFQTDIEASYWDLKDTNRTTRIRQKEDLSTMKNAHLDFMRNGDIRSYKAKLALLKLGKTPSEWKAMKDSVVEGLTGDSDFDRQSSSFLENYILSGGRERLHPATAR